MNFEYRCIDSSGKNVKGVIPAPGISEAKALLKGNGLTVLELLPKAPKAAGTLVFKKKVGDADIYHMARELSILLKSGIKIDRAFEILLNSIPNPQLKESVSSILKDIKAGKSVAGAFEDTKKFSVLATTMIYAGESSGDLRSAFENIAEHTSFQMRFKGDIKNALTYPVFLIFASLLTLFVIFKFIIPRFFSIFGKNPEASLPFTAKVLYSIGGLINMANIYVFLAILIGLAFAIRLMDMRKVFSGVYARLIYLPFLSKLIIYLELSRFSYSMYSMLNSGIEFINALKLSAGIIQQKRIRDTVAPAINRIKEGKGIADVFSRMEFLPEIVPNMLRVGEESGNLKEIFLELHQMFDERFKNAVKKILALVEPIVITITGIIVGFIVISLILTVMSAGNIKL